MFSGLADNFLNLEVLWRVRELLIHGAWVTLLLSALVVPSGIVCGLAIAMLQTASGGAIRVCLSLWIDFFRAFPPLVLLVLVYYGIPMVGADISALASIILAFTLNTSSYFAEIFRAGIESIARGQWDAARALGLSWIKTFALVILPQGIKTILPDLISNIVTVTQLTSLASVVSVFELLHAALVAQGTTYNATPLIAAGLIYVAMLLPLVRLLRRAEQRVPARSL